MNDSLKTHVARDRVGWVARCDCGTEMITRHTRVFAQEDARAHRKEHEETGNRSGHKGMNAESKQLEDRTHDLIASMKRVLGEADVMSGHVGTATLPVHETEEAAPDLLAAAEDALEVIERVLAPKRQTDTATPPTADALRSAIAKAKEGVSHREEP